MYALRRTLPVLCGYLFLGLAYGILLQSAGYNYIWAFFTSLFIYGGSIQFVLVSFLSGGVGLLTVAVMTLLINSRHLFYGLSFLQTFREMGRAFPYMIFSLTDETYSLLCSEHPPAEINPGRARFFIALLDHCYWILGSMLGALAGQLLSFNAAGVEFAMTALFVTIFIGQWQSADSHLPALIGLGSGLLFLCLLGPDNFILPSLCATVAALLLVRKKGGRS